MTRYRLLPRGANVLAAVSGGQDSLALLHCLHALRDELEFELFACHVHHGIRGTEADDDLAFVERHCSELGVPLTVVRCDAPAVAAEAGLSLEAAARQLRRSALQEVAGTLGNARIALAHTADDRAETVLLNMVRGTGVRGLSAMRVHDGPIVRPLLFVSRAMTGQYCRAIGLSPRVDRHNRDLRFRRNRVRTEFLPYLAAYFNPRVREALVRLAENAEEESDYLDSLTQDALRQLTREASAEAISIARNDFNALPRALRRRVIRAMVAHIRGDLTDLHWSIVDGVVSQADTPGCCTASWTLPSGRTVIKLGNSIEVSRPPEAASDFSLPLTVPGEARVPMAGVTVTAKRIQLTRPPDSVAPDCLVVPELAVVPPLVIRNARTGDRVRPLGLAGSKTLADCFTDRKVPRRQRQRIPVLSDAVGILWVPGVVADERVRIQATPCPCLEIRCTPTCE